MIAGTGMLLLAVSAPTFGFGRSVIMGCSLAETGESTDRGGQLYGGKKMNHGLSIYPTIAKTNKIHTYSMDSVYTQR